MPGPNVGSGGASVNKANILSTDSLRASEGVWWTVNKYSILTSRPETVSGGESTGRKNRAEEEDEWSWLGGWVSSIATGVQRGPVRWHLRGDWVERGRDPVMLWCPGQRESRWAALCRLVCGIWDPWGGPWGQHRVLECYRTKAERGRSQRALWPCDTWAFWVMIGFGLSVLGPFSRPLT